MEIPSRRESKPSNFCPSLFTLGQGQDTVAEEEEDGRPTASMTSTPGVVDE